MNWKIQSIYLYEKKAELIEKRYDVKIPRQTVQYHESIKSEQYLSKKEEKITQIIKERNIKFSGIVGYDESFFFINGKNMFVQPVLTVKIT